MPAPQRTAAPADDIDAGILDIALALFAEVGIKRVSPEDIARRAGINRATLYRRIGAKSDIVRAALLREIAGLRARIVAEVDRIEEPGERIAHGFALTVTSLRGNPVLTKTLAVDANEALEPLTSGAGAVMDMAVGFTEDWLRKAAPDLRATQEPAGLIVRLMHSLVLTPDAVPRLETHTELHDFATRWLCPMVLPDRSGPC
ncbi:TetR/AcrR family transcriptional regulator [Nocardia thailandica]